MKLGVREGDKVQILNGVRPGEEVVIVGGMGLDDKAKVKVIDTTVKEAPDEDENAPEETGRPRTRRKTRPSRNPNERPRSTSEPPTRRTGRRATASRSSSSS